MHFLLSFGIQDEARSQLGALKCQLAEMEAQRDLASVRVQQLQKQLATCEEGNFLLSSQEI